MTTKYYALLTNLGAAKLANAAALGTKLQITQMAVGDGGGTLPTPNASQTKLVGEKRRAALNSLSIDAANSSQIIAEQVIPESEGGFWIREVGLFDADGVLIAVANCAETYKPQLQEGSGRTQTVRMILIVSSTDAVTLKIDPSIVLATRQYVDNAVIEVKAYADDLMAKHVAAADPHTQYAPKKDPTLTGTPKAPTAAANKNDTQIATTAFTQAVMKAHTDAADPHAQYAPKKSPSFTGDGSFSGGLNVTGGGSYGATLTLGYRLTLQRAGGLPYQSFSRSDITSAPATDTEVGRVLFGYGMSGTDTWGTGGMLGYLNGLVMPTGGGKVNLVALNSALKNGASITLDGDAGNVSLTGDVSFSGTVNFNGIINANRHDSCINFSSSDATKPIIAMNYSGAGNFGFWDTTNNGWVLRKDASNNWIMYAGLTVAGAAALGDGSTVVTQVKTDNSTKIANTAFVQSAIAQLVGSSPDALDTLNELAAALGNDPNFATTMTNALAGKAALAGSVNQQFSVKDASADGQAVNRGQLNTGLAGKAALAGSTAQKFWVLSSPGDNNAAVPVSLLNSGLAGKVDSSGFSSGSNGNGAWSKIPGGGQWCRQNLSIPAKGNITWTFPAGFTAAPGVFITGINGDPAVWLTGVGPNNVGLYNNNDAALNVNLLAIW